MNVMGFGVMVDGMTAAEARVKTEEGRRNMEQERMKALAEEVELYLKNTFGEIKAATARGDNYYKRLYSSDKEEVMNYVAMALESIGYTTEKEAIGRSGERRKLTISW